MEAQMECESKLKMWLKATKNKMLKQGSENKRDMKGKQIVFFFQGKFIVLGLELSNG